MMRDDLHKKHILNLLTNPYYSQLIRLRSHIASACDRFFQNYQAPKVDLFLISQGVSSPMGKGSDSSPVAFQFGEEDVYLSDSAQFGMEPLVQKDFQMVYCYLPSFRNEDPDESHVNQFYHCEAELRGSYQDAMKVAEALVKLLLKEALIIAQELQFQAILTNQAKLELMTQVDFPSISFTEAAALLRQHGLKDCITVHEYGRTMTRKGELAIIELLTQSQTPVWITHYDCGTVPFYHKPDPINTTAALNADLLFPSLNGGFGGEILGLGQRQDSAVELLSTMQSQDIANISAYQWYIDLRNQPGYQTTSGFGLGIERFLAAIQSKTNIADVCLYPVLKNSHLYF